MAKQTSIIKLEGKCGDNVYYWHPKHGWLVRAVTSVDAERIRTDPAFALVREHNAQFAQSATFVKALRRIPPVIPAVGRHTHDQSHNQRDRKSNQSRPGDIA